MKVRFYVEKRKGEHGKLLDTDRPVFMSVSFHGNRIMVSTGKKVDRHWWDPDRQRIRDEHPEATVLNAWLDYLKHTADVTWNALASLSEKPGVDDFRKEFQRLKPRFSQGFFEVFYLFMENGSARWSSATYKKVRTVYNQLSAYEASVSQPLQFNRMDAEFIADFKRYLEARGQNYITVQKTVNVLVWFLNWATEEGFNVYREYRKFYRLIREKHPPQGRKTTFLNWEQLMQMYRMDVGSTKMERARDLFCLMCFTGIKYGEMKSLKKEHVEPERLIIHQQRGSARIIRLNRFAKTILDQYASRYYRGQAALPVMSLVTMNKYIRQAAADAGIDCASELTAGSATLTFIMNALRLDIPPAIIASYTGVKRDVRVQLMQQELADRHMDRFNTIPDE